MFADYFVAYAKCLKTTKQHNEHNAQTHQMTIKSNPRILATSKLNTHCARHVGMQHRLRHINTVENSTKLLLACRQTLVLSFEHVVNRQMSLVVAVVEEKLTDDNPNSQCLDCMGSLKTSRL